MELKPSFFSFSGSAVAVVAGVGVVSAGVVVGAGGVVVGGVVSRVATAGAAMDISRALMVVKHIISMMARMGSLIEEVEYFIVFVFIGYINIDFNVGMAGSKKMCSASVNRRWGDYKAVLCVILLNNFHSKHSFVVTPTSINRRLTIKKMDKIKVIITGATGMVGEGVMLECLDNEKVSEVLIVNRRHYDLAHPKLKELLIPDFLIADGYAAQLTGYDGCFFCAGISSIGLNEEEYRKITYDTTLHFAKVVLQHNPNMVFIYVSGASTDSSEKGRMMWARVKGKTENDLMKMPFRGEYNFRPGVMSHVKGQKNVKKYFKPFIWLIPKLFPGISLTLNEVGQAMINAVLRGYSKSVLEVKDIKALAK